MEENRKTIVKFNCELKTLFYLFYFILKVTKIYDKPVYEIKYLILSFKRTLIG